MSQKKPVAKQIKRNRRDCYCSVPNNGFTCNACFNAVVEAKNILVRENYKLQHKTHTTS